MIRCLSVLSYMWAMSLCTWILFVLVLIYFSRLHSCVEVFTRGMFRGGDMCLDLVLGKKIKFLWCFNIFYFFGIICEYYICVVLSYFWEITRK